MVPHHGTSWAALWLTAQIRRDAVLSESYGRGHLVKITYAPYATTKSVLENATKRSTENATKWRLHRALGGLQERATDCA